MESLLTEKISIQGRRLLQIMISQVNLLMSLVNDILDQKLIEEGKFKTKDEAFSPKDCFDFIINMFQSQVEMQKTKISFQALPYIEAPEERKSLSKPITMELQDKKLQNHQEQ